MKKYSKKVNFECSLFIFSKLSQNTSPKNLQEEERALLILTDI